jgi:hypothetical protein
VEIWLAQPEDNLIGMAVYLPHLLNLVSSFFIISLVDADRVNPKCTIHFLGTELLERKIQILRDVEGFSVYYD